MAFVKVEKRHTGGYNNTVAMVTMGAYLADGKVHKSRSINFRLTHLLVQQLGWEVVDRKLNVAIHEGIDADKGFLQIVLDPNGRRISQTVEGQGFSLSAIVESFKHYVLNECPMPSAPVSHVIDNGALIIECPDWLRYNPESVPQEAPAPKVTSMLNREQRRAAATQIARNLKR